LSQLEPITFGGVDKGLSAECFSAYPAQHEGPLPDELAGVMHVHADGQGDDFIVEGHKPGQSGVESAVDQAIFVQELIECRVVFALALPVLQPQPANSQRGLNDRIRTS